MKGARMVTGLLRGRREALALLTLLVMPIAYARAGMETTRPTQERTERQQNQRPAAASGVRSNVENHRAGVESDRSNVMESNISAHSDAPNKRSADTPAPDPRQVLLERHDWKGHFRSSSAAVVSGLQLPIDAQRDAASSVLAYQIGKPYYLYIGLKNHEHTRRLLDTVPACGRLSRADTLRFRVGAGEGTQLILPNRYKDKDDRHQHAPLVIEGDGTLVGIVDFNELVATSGELFALVKTAEKLTITAEIADPPLKSNTIEIELR